MALSADRATTTCSLDNSERGVAASVTIYAGAMVALDTDGYYRPARASTTDRVVGFNDGNKVANGTTAGAVKCKVQRDEGAWFANSASADAITAADIGYDCYAVDDQTVARTDATGTRVRAGKIADVDATRGVLVDFKARGSSFTTLKATMADVSAASDTDVVAAPVTGRVFKFYTVLQGAITGADSVVTPKIGSTAMTGGAVTVANAASAAGDIDLSYPTAANLVAGGVSTLKASTDGASSTTAILNAFFVIETP
jgi:hypothetical protein